MDELKACPFCGAENTDVGFIAHTDDCYLMRRYIGASSRKELGIAWNTRPIEDELRYPVMHIWRIEESYPDEQRAHGKEGADNEPRFMDTLRALLKDLEK
jgi:hypothetical protein